MPRWSPSSVPKVFTTPLRGSGNHPAAIYGTIIKAHALAGHLDRAEACFESYRKTIFLQNQNQDVPSPSVLTKDVMTDCSGFLRNRLESAPQGSNKPSQKDGNFPYAALLIGYGRSSTPLSQRIEWLLECMRLDGITPDINMCNMLIAAFSRWGWSHRAYAVYRSMLAPTSVVLPDAYTFRHIFIMLNPMRKHGPHDMNVPEEMTGRQLFKELIALDRLRLYPRKPQPHKNLVSTATFNCALRTFMAQGDYAAAWTVLSCFTRHHVCPDTDTLRNVILGLLRRMKQEVEEKNTINNVVWVDRFLGERRSTITQVPNKRMLADRLFTIGCTAVTELETSRCETYLKPSLEINGGTERALNHLVGTLRVSLQASLGFPHPTQHQLSANKVIKVAMLQARSDMIPRGRLQRN